METVGVYLKKEREAKNISLREVARLTKISEFYLDYIEKDDYEKLPQGPYIKGYISSYSRLIGGDVDEALKLYDSLHTEKHQVEEIQPEIPKHKEWTVRIGASLNSIVSLFKNRKNIGRSGPLEKTSATQITSSKTATTRLKTHIISFLQKTSAAVAANRWLTQWRTWLSACIALFGIGILVLAGFGFYHLFIYEVHQPLVAETQVLANKERSALLSKPVDQKRPSSVSTNAEVAKSLATSTTERSDNTSTPPDHQGSTLPKRSSLPPTQGASPQTTVGRERDLLADQNQMVVNPSKEPTRAAVNLSVLKASICSKIVDRMPAGVDSSFPSSVQRVYVWSQIEAKQIPSEIRHIYYFKGRKINDVSLSIRSPFWRTWSYKSISSDRYRGQWQVDIATAGGKVLRRLYFEIE